MTGGTFVGIGGVMRKCDCHGGRRLKRGKSAAEVEGAKECDMMMSARVSVAYKVRGKSAAGRRG